MGVTPAGPKPAAYTIPPRSRPAAIYGIATVLSSGSSRRPGCHEAMVHGSDTAIFSPGQNTLPERTHARTNSHRSYRDRLNDAAGRLRRRPARQALPRHLQGFGRRRDRRTHRTARSVTMTLREALGGPVLCPRQRQPERLGSLAQDEPRRVRRSQGGRLGMVAGGRARPRSRTSRCPATDAKRHPEPTGEGSLDGTKSKRPPAHAADGRFAPGPRGISEPGSARCAKSPCDPGFRSRFPASPRHEPRCRARP